MNLVEHNAGQQFVLARVLQGDEHDGCEDAARLPFANEKAAFVHLNGYCLCGALYIMWYVKAVDLRMQRSQFRLCLLWFYFHSTGLDQAWTNLHPVERVADNDVALADVDGVVKLLGSRANLC